MKTIPVTRTNPTLPSLFTVSHSPSSLCFFSPLSTKKKSAADTRNPKTEKETLYMRAFLHKHRLSLLGMGLLCQKINKSRPRQKRPTLWRMLHCVNNSTHLVWTPPILETTWDKILGCSTYLQWEGETKSKPCLNLSVVTGFAGNLASLFFMLIFILFSFPYLHHGN